MKNAQIKILLFSIIVLIISCSTNKGLIKREKSVFGTVKYYVQTDLNDEGYKKRMIIKVADSVYYSFYSDGINKSTKKDKNSVYRLFYEEVPKELDAQIAYQKLSKLDSLILSSSNRILDSLKWKDFKRWNGATAFNIEVIYYHGFPKNGKFEPY
ncbi:hypothetical protein RM545_17110 [Zunongwangia sp. F260]|uniref:Lipoprotein n=1 Tax=Autumnicola lenta TaxID=3075593 RepID=A0ABU3CPY0_9FLAO|nr:hypothetical protein [Zunongwangia sp. F260]MDT0648414.1 hypothetical protein [Zunongwangia sp. F260]